MLKAVCLARRGLPFTAPNPAVGALLLQNGRIVAEGWHKKYGGPHAEIEALGDARRKGVNPADCTLLVTLEPCNHHGKTPPCAEAILQAGVKKVVIGLSDPTPQAGGGAAWLAARGVQVIMGVAETQCRNLAADFLFWQHSDLPYVTLKLASTLDGCIATRSGQSRWITGKAARARVHMLRAMSQAVLVGGNTFFEDDPLLTARPQDFAIEGLEGNINCPASPEGDETVWSDLACATRDYWRAKLIEQSVEPAWKNEFVNHFPSQPASQPLAVVVSGRSLDFKRPNKLLTSRGQELVFITSPRQPLFKQKRELSKHGVRILEVPEQCAANLPIMANSQPAATAEQQACSCSDNFLSAEELRCALVALRRDFGCWRVLCEGGGKLALALLKAGLVQEFELHLAPRLMADALAKRLFEGLCPQNISDTLGLSLQSQARLGQDVVLLFKP